MFLDDCCYPLAEAGVAEWLSRWPRDPRSIEVGKPASGPRARRGSNPFPGATLPIVRGRGAFIEVSFISATVEYSLTDD